MRPEEVAIYTKSPLTATDADSRAFAGLVRRGFEGARDVEARMRAAAWLAYCYSEDALAAIAALKGPTESYRESVFRQAQATGDPRAYRHELGWVYVVPGHRRQGTATRLCRALIGRVPDAAIFATTDPQNLPMLRILDTLGFVQTGRPYLRGTEPLVLFVRPMRKAP